MMHLEKAKEDEDIEKGRQPEREKRLVEIQFILWQYK